MAMMIAANVLRLGRKLGVVAATAAVFVVLAGAAANAAEQAPEAVIVNSDGEVVVEIATRADAGAALEEAAMLRRGGRLRLQYIYQSQGSFQSPPNDPLLSQQWSFNRIGVPAAWAQTDGDGRDSVSIWRPSEARVYVINELGVDGGGLGAAEFSFLFGQSGDMPFVGDFDGDGVDTVGLYRQSTGFAYLRNSLTTGNADLSFFYGDPGDQILVGDWDGDGDDSVAVYRPSTGRLYVNLSNSSGPADWDGFVGSYNYLVTAGNR